jgi:hypothetical protein
MYTFRIFETPKVTTFVSVTSHFSRLNTPDDWNPLKKNIFFYFERAGIRKEGSRKDSQREDTDFAQ